MSKKSFRIKLFVKSIQCKNKIGASKKDIAIFDKEINSDEISNPNT